MSTTASPAPAVARVRELLTVEVLAHDVPVTPEAIVRNLTTAERLQFAQDATDARPLVRSALAALEATGNPIAVPGGYVLPQMPVRASRRKRTRNRVVQIVAVLRRAVRSGDVWAYASENAQREVALGGLTASLISRDMLNLTHTGELVVVATLRGDTARGKKLVLP